MRGEQPHRPAQHDRLLDFGPGDDFFKTHTLLSMALRTADEYRQSLRDGRVLWFRGERVPDLTAHPQLRVAVDHAAIDYEMPEPWKDDDLGEEISRYFALPRSGDDLMARSRLIEATKAAGG